MILGHLLITSYHGRWETRELPRESPSTSHSPARRSLGEGGSLFRYTRGAGVGRGRPDGLGLAVGEGLGVAVGVGVGVGP